MTGFEKLIAALQIFSKYSDTQWPTHCEHDTLYVCVEPSAVSEEDKTTLLDLGFIPNGENFSSYTFGSA